MTQNTEQNVRTRDEQVDEYFFDNQFQFAEDMTEEDFKAALIEAEARGAEEQRRKDAEGQKPVAWRYEVKRMGYWVSREVGYGPRVWEWYWDGERPDPADPDYRNVSPLYDRPANVPAMEARVKELEESKGRKQEDARRYRNALLTICDKTSEYSISHQTARAALTREGGE